MKRERDTISTSCAICESPLREEIEKKDALLKTDETVIWARKQGLRISKFSLAKHRANHGGKPSSEHITTSVEPEPQKRVVSTSEIATSPRPAVGTPGNNIGNGLFNKPVIAGERSERGILSAAADVSAKDSSSKPEPATGTKSDQKPAPASDEITDQIFLDTVRDMVYQKLLDGEMEMKLESAFKAIEIKYKIAEESQNEKLLLEILNELRTQELKGISGAVS
jgi:hypothetical protein